MNPAIRLLMLSLFVGILLRAQDSPVQAGVSVKGLVQDPSGAAIPKAKLALTRASSGEAQKTAADGSGAFTFDNITPGDYSLQSEAKGFEAAVSKLKVRVKPLDVVKVTLNIATKGEEVTVTANRKDEEANVNLDRNADQLNFEDNLLRGLPAPDQNIMSIIANFVSPAAQGAEGLSIIVDGVEMDAFSLPANAIRRVRINRNPYAVQFRRPGKARVEVYTEEGSFRRYHGSVSFYARNSVFDGRNAFASSKPDMDRRLMAANFGGPLFTKKAAFFVSGEHLNNNESSVVNALTLNGPFVANVRIPDRHTNLLGRVEVKASKSHTLFALYTFRDESEDNRGAGGFRLPDQGYPTAERQHRFQLSDRGIFSKLINDVRFSLDRDDRNAGRTATGPAIIVHGAFTGGSPQTFRSRDETSLRFQDVATYYSGVHAVRFGAEVHPGWYNTVERSDFGGTFEFSNLEQFASGRPFVYRVNQGDPQVFFGQHEVFSFVQDEIRVRSNFSFTAGVRYGWQSNVSDRNNFAPRLAFAYSPGKQKTVVRSGAGFFYERVSADAARRSLLFDGLRLREVNIANPSFPEPALRLAIPPASVIRTAPNLSLPYVLQASVSVERELWKRTHATIEYQTLRGLHLLRSRDLNAPFPGTFVRPSADLLNIDLIESSASMRSHSLSVTWRGGWGKWFNGMAQYTLSDTKNDTSGLFALPADNHDLRPEWGRADFDQRHRFSLVGTIDLPSGLRFGAFVTLASGVPYNITTGRDDNRDTVANDRPPGVTRNTGDGPGLIRLDLRLTKMFRAPRLLDRKRDHTSRNVELSIDAFNLFNHGNFANFIGVQTSPFFGHANAALQPRTFQLSVRYKL